MTAVPHAKANGAHASEAETEPWPWRLRKWIVKKGISIMRPNSSLSTNVAADIPLFRAGMRLAYLKALAALGISNFVARSGLGYNFVCHVGDLAAFPFYHPGAYRAELELASAWLRMTEQPLAFDVGANEGFFACHLAQMIGRRGKIYAFEPVPETDMIYAATPEEIEQRRKAFIRKWRLRHRPIANCLEEAGDRLFTFTRLPPSQWRSARTTNAIERLHEEFKRRIKTQTVLLCG